MAVRNFRIQKKGEGYLITEQAGSNYHREVAVHEAPNQEDAKQWLRKEGGAPDLVDQALTDATPTAPVFLEMVGNYTESEEFPKL